jgi:NADH-quinone oxidoreductase subunit C
MNPVEFMGEKTVAVANREAKAYLAGLKAAFPVLMDMTAVDYLEPEAHTVIVYWLHNPDSLERLRVTVTLSRGEEIQTVTDLWAGADWYERELYDLFGVVFHGHPDLKRILMPDDWRGHPLRKDYALTEEPVEFKHGVKPKVPSQIIPNVKTLWSYDKQQQ